MAKLFFCLAILGTLAYVSADLSSSFQLSTTTDAQVEPFATALSRWLVERVSEKILAVARFFHLKIRVAKFLVSLYTTENLMLLRNLIEHAIKVGNFALKILPVSIEDPGYWWVSTVSHFLNVNVGSGGLLGIAIGQPVSEVDSEELDEAPSETADEVVTDPPIFFNQPASATDQPIVNEVNIDPIREARSAKQETHFANDNDPKIKKDQEQSPDEILKKYGDRIMTLDKLINSSRK